MSFNRRSGRWKSFRLCTSVVSPINSVQRYLGLLIAQVGHAGQVGLKGNGVIINLQLFIDR